ncbi:MAG: PAS domain S-box protein [Burkholderiales bacterium]
MEELFRAAVDAHPDTIVMVDAGKGVIVYANDGACRNLGYRREELVGQPPDMIFADRDAARLALRYERLKNGPTLAPVYSAMLIRKDASVFPVEVSTTLIQRPEGDYILGIARDVSARDETQRALHEQEQRLALALESSELAMFDWDVPSGRVRLGPRWNTILGREPVETATSIADLEHLVHPDDLPGLRERLRWLLEGEIPAYRTEHRVRNHSGDWIWIESAAEVNERDASGRPVRVTGTNGDISSRRKLAEMKDTFVAAVSHELRTPLTGIVASLELLREGSAGELPPDARRFVDMACANGERLTQLIEDILNLEGAQSGRVRLELEPVEMASLLHEAASLNASYAERYQARLRVEASAGLRVKADRKRLLQVVANFISNAAKFSPPGGEIRLGARSGAEGRVVLSVSDQGPGVPEEFKPRLFGRFEQAEQDKGSTGLGLAICKALVERMGGTVGYETAPGGGASFFAELPAAD